MKNKPLIIVSLLLFLSLSITSFRTEESTINWMTWEEAIKKVQTDKNPKKIFIDVYTDWCGWCKKMDKNTFNHPDVAPYMNEHFYMVKMNAESKEDIEYKGKTFKFVSNGRSGYHELAAALLQGRLSYPTVIFMDKDQKILSPVPGYQEADEFLKIARFFGDDIYKNKSWQEYDTEKTE